MIPITRTAGVATSHVDSSCLAESTHVLDRVTKGLVVPVKSVSLRGVTAVRKRRVYCAASGNKRGIAAYCTRLKMGHRLLSVGSAFLSARTHVNGHSTVGSISAANLAIDKTRTQPIALALPMLCLVALVAKHLYGRCQQLLGRLAKTQYRIVPSLVILD